jgi:hypothetical protein
MASDNERQASVLTNSQREYLQGLRDPEGAAERSMKSRIRARVSASITDFPLIVDGVDPVEIIDGVDDGLVNGLKSQVRFVYKCASAAGLHPQELIDDAVQEAQQGRIERIAQKYENDPESLTLGELSDLYKSGAIPEDEYEDLFRSALGAPNPGTVTMDDVADYLGREGDNK